MNRVSITVGLATFAVQMAAMRLWLDDCRYEPLSFTCDRRGDIYFVCIDFNKAEEARAFKQHFLQQKQIQSPILDSQQSPSKTPKPETMEQVCWWRLMAEEVRTEADEFGSHGTKETMEQVALSYERLADELERRLSKSSGSVSWLIG